MPRKRSVCAIATTALLAVALGCTDTTDATGVDPTTGVGPQFASSGQWVAQVVGGLRGLGPGAQRDIAVLAVQAQLFADGSVSGTVQTSRLFVHPGFPSDDQVVPLFIVHGDVTCLAVDGNRAWIGGTIVRGFFDVGQPPDGSRIDVAGFDFVEFLIDNGDGTVDVQVQFQAASSCGDKGEPGFFATFTNGNLKIMER